ncbi:MAG: hypothetical protein DRI95_13940 [Bacteroidetes bacterium]|nr:MAG: hypothetical protein DRI95_13940 [Bacteroidota bacterium]
MGIIIREVSTKEELKTFIRFPDKLYKHNKFYIPALHRSEMLKLFPDGNPAFEICEAKYWIAYFNNEVVGRVAGIINFRYNQKHDKKYARFGWLDFIEHKNVLEKLMQSVEIWSKFNNAEFIHGPLGFSSFDASGVLVDGFDELPTSFAHYNFPYYPELLEKLGYNKDVDWLEYNVKVPESVPQNFVKVADLVKKKYKLHSAKLKNKKDLLKYSDNIFKLLNEEYKDLYAFSELTKNQIEELKKQFMSFIKPEYVSIVLSTTNRIVAFGITVPSLSKALQKSKGKLFPFGFMRIMYALRKNDTADTLLIAIEKDYQNRGVHTIIFNDIFKTFVKNGITNIETTRELEDNFNVNNLWKKFEYKQHKRARCYIKKL